MKNFTFLVILLIILAAGSFYLYKQKNKTVTSTTTSSPQSTEKSSSTDVPQTEVIAQGLDTPWSIVFLPDKSMLFTERPGRVRYISPLGQLDATPIATFNTVKELGEGGLLGMVLHPQFASNNYIYFYYTYSGSGKDTLNRVVRMTYKNKKLSNEKIIVDQIPASSNHNGGRLKFGPDNYLYITTGDAENPSQAQDKNALGGKILRVTDEGKAAPGNPFNNRTYSYGHRNPQGLAWDDQGNLWETEHGPSGLETGNDEVNKIQAGKNYGWSIIRGQETHNGMETPVIESGRGTAWAPASLAFLNGKLYFAGLKGQALYEFDPKTNQLTDHLNGDFGRLRETIVGPDGLIYISTSNKDSRGQPQEGDDKIIRVNTAKL